MLRPLVLYHARCPDGMAAAWVVRKFFTEKGLDGKYTDAEFVPTDYGTPLPRDFEGRAVYCVDFCPDRPEHLLRLADGCPALTIIDHHKTTPPAMALLAGRPNVQFVYDKNHSGGFLCWEHFFPDADPPPLVRYTQDRDLWTWKLPRSREVSAYLSTLPWDDFAAWTEADDTLRAAGERPHESHGVVVAGRTVLALQRRLIEDHKLQVFETELDGHAVPAVNCSCDAIISDLAGELAAGRAFAVAWYVRHDGQAKVSLRSRGETGIDVTTVTTRYGGGGHAQAGGFQVPADALPFRTARPQSGGLS